MSFDFVAMIVMAFSRIVRTLSVRRAWTASENSSPVPRVGIAPARPQWTWVPSLKWRWLCSNHDCKPLGWAGILHCESCAFEYPGNDGSLLLFWTLNRKSDH